MAIANLHRMTPEEREKALGKEKEVEEVKEIKPEKSKR